MEVRSGNYKEEFKKRWKVMKEEEKILEKVFSLLNKLKEKSKEERDKVTEEILGMINKEDISLSRYILDKEWCTRVIAMDVVRGVHFKVSLSSYEFRVGFDVLPNNVPSFTHPADTQV